MVLLIGKLLIICLIFLNDYCFYMFLFFVIKVLLYGFLVFFFLFGFEYFVNKK